jgi:hypothetical protein
MSRPAAESSRRPPCVANVAERASVLLPVTRWDGEGDPSARYGLGKTVKTVS